MRKKYSFIIFLIVFLLCHCFVSADAKMSVEKTGKQNIKKDKVIEFQDYVILSREPIKAIKSRNEEIVEASIMQTVDNKRNTAILKAKSLGNTKIDVKFEKDNYEICVRVKNSKTMIYTKCKYFNFVKIDAPDGVVLLEGNKK